MYDMLKSRLTVFQRHACGVRSLVIINGVILGHLTAVLCFIVPYSAINRVLPRTHQNSVFIKSVIRFLLVTLERYCIVYVCYLKVNRRIISLAHDHSDVVHVPSRVSFPHPVSSYPIVALTILLFLSTHRVVMTHLTQIRLTACILKWISRIRCSHQAIVSMRRKPCLLGLDIVL